MAVHISVSFLYCNCRRKYLNKQKILKQTALCRPGRVEHNWVARVSGHGGPVLDIKWSPFNDNIIASSSEDGAVKVITRAN